MESKKAVQMSLMVIVQVRSSRSDETPDTDECDSATGQSIVASADSSIIVID